VGSYQSLIHKSGGEKAPKAMDLSEPSPEILQAAKDAITAVQNAALYVRDQSCQFKCIVLPHENVDTDWDVFDLWVNYGTKAKRPFIQLDLSLKEVYLSTMQQQSVQDLERTKFTVGMLGLRDYPVGVMVPLNEEGFLYPKCAEFVSALARFSQTQNDAELYISKFALVVGDNPENINKSAVFVSKLTWKVIFGTPNEDNPFHSLNNNKEILYHCYQSRSRKGEGDQRPVTGGKALLYEQLHSTAGKQAIKGISGKGKGIKRLRDDPLDEKTTDQIYDHLEVFLARQVVKYDDFSIPTAFYIYRMIEELRQVMDNDDTFRVEVALPLLTDYKDDPVEYIDEKIDEWKEHLDAELVRDLYMHLNLHV